MPNEILHLHVLEPLQTTGAVGYSSHSSHRDLVPRLDIRLCCADRLPLEVRLAIFNEQQKSGSVRHMSTVR